MAAQDDGSVTGWIRDLGAGKREEASRLLWERYFAQLARLAQGRLRGIRRGHLDGEDVALSVFDCFIRGAATGRYPRLGNRDDLWRLLVTITARKAHNQRRNEGRQKRGAGRVIGEADLTGSDPDSDAVLAQTVSHEPTPEVTAIVIEEYRRLFDILADESLRVVALLKLEGHSNEEIAGSLDCGLRTVERKLEVIRKRWLAKDKE